MKNTYKYIIGIIAIIFVIIIGILFYKSSKETIELSKSFTDYMDTYIHVKIYTNDEEKGNDALKHVDEIFSEYHNLTNKYADYENGLYRLNKSGTSIDKKLYDIIEYGYNWYDKSNHLLNIGIGNVTDIWKKYREAENGVPSIEELKSVSIDFNNIKLDNGSVKLKNGVTIDLGSLAKGYAVDVVGEYLESVGINKYIINAGGNVLVGKKYHKDKYKIGIEDPTGEVAIYKIVKAEEVAIVTSGGYRRSYTYNGVNYNHIIDPNTLYPANNMLSVTVITKESKLADVLSTTLFLMSYEDGMEFIKDYDAEVIWYLNDGTIKTTDGISKYE